MIDKSDIEFYAFLYTWIGESVGNSSLFLSHFLEILSHIGKVILVIGVLDMGNEFSPFSGKVSATSEQGLWWSAFRKDRHRPWASCRPGAGPLSYGHLFCRFWLCLHGWLSYTEHVPGQRGCSPLSRDRRSSTR